MTGWYRLEGTEPVRCHTLMEWATWHQSADTRVVLDKLGGWTISTVFLGLDHGWREDAPPILFETMTFYDGSAKDQERCATWIGAEWQHAQMVERVIGRLRLRLIETPRLLTPRRGQLRAVK